MSPIVNKFVFVVCGGAEHIQTLNFSITYLKKYSDNEIIVVTDTTRNEVRIDHNLIYDIQTPAHFNHHQASIFLKTGLNQFLEMAPNIRYCYLDTDVIAVRPGVDTIFSFYKSPITFCSDHCRMDRFSPQAVYDVQSKVLIEKQKQLDAVLAKHQKLEEEMQERNRFHEKKVIEITKAYQESIPPKIFEFEQQWAEVQTQYFEKHYPKGVFNPLVYIHSLFLFSRKVKRLNPPQDASLKIKLADFVLSKSGRLLDVLSSSFLRLITPVLPNALRTKVKRCLNGDSDFIAFFEQKGFRFDKVKKIWCSPEGDQLFLPRYDFYTFVKGYGYFFDVKTNNWYTPKGELVFYGHSFIKAVEQETGFVWDEQTECWKDKEGNVLHVVKSDTLARRIKEKFGLSINEPDWQHWNGGVFIFDHQSSEFLNTWHQWTLEIFKDPLWKTRDQGTLIATAWNYDLKDHQVLPVEYNFIADYYHMHMSYKGDLTFDLLDKKKDIKPFFLHVYHHFGDKNWDLWKDIETSL